MNISAFLVIAASALLVAGCGAAPEGDSASSGQSNSLAGLKIGGPFDLVDQDGKRVRWDDFRGKYRLVYFGYTYCPDVCPVDLQRIMQAYRHFEKTDPQRAARIQPIFISVDPGRDSPTVLKSYVSAFHPRLIGLTGTDAEIAAVAKSFAVAYGKEEAKEGAPYQVFHSRTPYLFDPDGGPLALVPVDNPATPEQEGQPAEIERFFEQMVR